MTLHSAARKGDLAAVRVALAREDIESRKGARSQTALHVAARHGRLPVLRHLIAAGAEVDARDGSGETALSLALLNAQPEAAVVLLEAGADPDSTCDRGTHVGWRPAAEGNVEMLALLVRFGSRPERRGNLLDVASERGIIPTIRFLLDNGHDVNELSSEQQTMLHGAVRFNATAAAWFLLENGADVNAEDRFGQRPIQSTHFRTPEALKVRLTEGLRPEPRMLVWFAEGGDLIRVRWHLDNGGDPNAPSSRFAHADRPLHVACYKGHTSVVRLLLERGADPNLAAGHDREPALHHGIRCRDRDRREPILRLLIEAGADLMQADRNAITPVGRAAMHDQVKLMRLFFDQGVDVTAPAKGAAPPICLVNDRAAFDMLIEQGGAAPFVGADGETPMHIVASRNRPRWAERLLAAGLSLEGRDAAGRTPYLVAAASGAEKMISWLAAQGASLDVVDAEGLGAEALARQGRHRRAVGRIRQLHHPRPDKR